MLRQLRLRTSGFTIVELLIVIVVIGILAAVVILAYNGLTNRARDAAVLSDTDAVESEVVRYSTNNEGEYGSAVAWYSGGAANANIDLTPSAGNVIDVVADDDEYCIRTYNPAADQYSSLATAYEKGSTATACDGLDPSAAALADSPIPVNVAYGEDFESGYGEWSVMHGSDTAALVSDPVHGGTQSFHFTTNEYNYESAIRALVGGFDVGQTYTVSAWVYTNDPSGQNSAYFDAWDGTTYDQLSTSCANPSSGILDSGVWQQVSCTFTTDSSDVYFILWYGNGNWDFMGPHEVYIDDIQVVSP